MKINFTLSEFIISGNSIPLSVGDKILKYHIEPMNIVRDIIQIPVYPSQHSGYRTKEWELSHGRSGNSQHTFTGKGAVDWTCKNFEDNKDDLLNLIIEHTEYTRIAIYNSFIHCDLKETSTGKREVFKSDSSSKWTFIKHV